MPEPRPHLIYFCHGIPGGPTDADLFKAALPAGASVVTPNLLEKLDPEKDITDQILVQFDNLTSKHGGADICVVGFSMGAMAACQIAARRPSKVRQLVLISAAAPLELGHFLPDMAGAPVFLLSKQRPKFLKALTWVQGLLTRVAPGYLLGRMFQGSDRAELQLLSQPVFKSKMRQAMFNSFCRHPKAYAAFLRAYTSPWEQVLKDVQSPVEMWHGQADIWAPSGMANAIQDALPNPSTLYLAPDAGHYKTLIEARPLAL